MSGDHNKYCSANNPKDEWTELNTLQDVAKAQADGWEIEYRHMAKEGWNPWSKTWWQEDSFYRARPRQPKMKKVKMLCWMVHGVLQWVAETNVQPACIWYRIPAQDIEIEIPEGV